MYYNLINILGLRPRHGNEKRSTHDSDRSCEEGSVRKAVRCAGPDALTGRAATDPRLPRSAWRQLPDQKRNWRASAPENRLRYACARSAMCSRAGIALAPGSTAPQVSWAGYFTTHRQDSTMHVTWRCPTAADATI